SKESDRDASSRKPGALVVPEVKNQTGMRRRENQNCFRKDQQRNREVSEKQLLGSVHLVVHRFMFVTKNVGDVDVDPSQQQAKTVPEKPIDTSSRPPPPVLKTAAYSIKDLSRRTFLERLIADRRAAPPSIVERMFSKEYIKGGLESAPPSQPPTRPGSPKEAATKPGSPRETATRPGSPKGPPTRPGSPKEPPTRPGSPKEPPTRPGVATTNIWCPLSTIWHFLKKHH
ncbi:hypothetical protein ANCDUO_13150, partial [Ancylostoma duodenale]